MRTLILSVLLCGSSVAASSDIALSTFEERLNSYVKLRKEATSRVPQLGKKSQPEDIEQHQLALAEAIRKARPAAKAGDILSEDVKPIFHKLLRGAMKGGKGQDVRASIKEGNPTTEKAPGEVVPHVAVNAIYPKNAPLSTVPPTLLMKLPKLPKDIEYRFVGRTLVLRDRESNLIVDYMKEAVPAV